MMFHIKTFGTIILLVCTLLSLISCKQPMKDQSHGNRLALAGSPYLREHADNPVHWFEWSPAALEKAKKENKPLIISIGYASCHWCHVMEEESFMDTAVARMMNENFVSIKIDREERPDIDQIYLNAAQLISGSAGWPLNAFTIPDGKPFYAGTYYPKDQWIKLLGQINDAYKQKNELINKQAEELTNGIRSGDLITTVADTSSADRRQTFETLFDSLDDHLDYKSGGFVEAPKFPLPGAWEFLLEYHHLTGNKKALKAVMSTLDGMASGGIYDQLAGGFSRYAIDREWKVPHFEKMLYDNGQLISLYSHAYQVTGKQDYAEIIRTTLKFIKDEMTDPDGGFYASLNADSEGTEGKFYTWTSSEIEKILGKENAILFNKYYHVTDSGNWENGTNILFTNTGIELFARDDKKEKDGPSEKIQQARKELLKVRNERVRPSTDNKILTAWNALMLKGYVDAYFALGDGQYLEAAIKNARFLERHMMQTDGKLLRSYIDQKAGIDAFLDDYALLASAFIRLYEATFDIQWLNKARNLAEYTLEHFVNEETGLFYYTSVTAQNLVARKMELSDNVIPSSNSVLADVLFRLGHYYSNDRYIMMSESMLTRMHGQVSANARHYANWSRLLAIQLHQPYEVAITGDNALALSKQLQSRFFPNALFMGGTAENLPLLEEKVVSGQTIIYVCRNKVCKLPVKSVEAAVEQLK